ncbi:uncharacterized protein LOC128366497 [Scomber japonicus]|uniref:uncharacterized protein LOC128366497 n=1 Tax=Scomber japonicus TaxID=13676 RepID=UPI0023060F85|nr:uncharacterized protein LOC128366497 [Scomber japonicus]
MRNTFVCDDSMIITIPICSLRDAREGQLMPDKFHCVFKDTYKVFAIRGKPKPLGAAQAIAGVFVLTLGLISKGEIQSWWLTLPSILFVVSGFLTYAAGQCPNIHLTKLSFSVNIICFFWSIAAVCLCAVMFDSTSEENRTESFHRGINGLIISLLVGEKIIALFLIYWLSKAVCREHFNSLPMVLLKQGD